MFLFQWWHAVLLLLCGYIFAEWYARKSFQLGYNYGIVTGVESLFEFLVNNKYVKCVDSNMQDPVLVAWEDEPLTETKE